MKLFPVFFIILILAGCEVAKLTPEQEEFHDVCIRHHGDFANKVPLRDGKPQGGEPCMGCMPDAKTHFCDEREYLAYINATA